MQKIQFHLRSGRLGHPCNWFARFCPAMSQARRKFGMWPSNQQRSIPHQKLCTLTGQSQAGMSRHCKAPVQSPSLRRRNALRPPPSIPIVRILAGRILPHMPLVPMNQNQQRSNQLGHLCRKSVRFRSATSRGRRVLGMLPL